MKKIILACSIALFAALLTPGQETGLLTLGQGTDITTNREYVPVVITNRLTQKTKVIYVPLVDQERTLQIPTTQQDVPIKITNGIGEEIKLESLPLKDQEYVRRVGQTAQSLFEPEFGIFNGLNSQNILLQRRQVAVIFDCRWFYLDPPGRFFVFCIFVYIVLE